MLFLPTRIAHFFFLSLTPRRRHPICFSPSPSSFSRPSGLLIQQVCPNGPQNEDNGRARLIEGGQEVGSRGGTEDGAAATVMAARARGRFSFARRPPARARGRCFSQRSRPVVSPDARPGYRPSADVCIHTCTSDQARQLISHVSAVEKMLVPQLVYGQAVVGYPCSDAP